MTREHEPPQVQAGTHPTGISKERDGPASGSPDIAALVGRLENCASKDHPYGKNGAWQVFRDALEAIRALEAALHEALEGWSSWEEREEVQRRINELKKLVA
jgi:hypothetical protein